MRESTAVADNEETSIALGSCEGGDLPAAGRQSRFAPTVADRALRSVAANQALTGTSSQARPREKRPGDGEISGRTPVKITPEPLTEPPVGTVGSTG